MNCYLCKCKLKDCASYFQRVNPTGEEGIWKCAYGCNVPAESPVIAAIEGKTEDASQAAS